MRVACDFEAALTFECYRVWGSRTFAREVARHLLAQPLIRGIEVLWRLRRVSLKKVVRLAGDEMCSLDAERARGIAHGEIPPFEQLPEGGRTKSYSAAVRQVLLGFHP